MTDIPKAARKAKLLDIRRPLCPCDYSGHSERLLSHRGRIRPGQILFRGVYQTFRLCEHSGNRRYHLSHHCQSGILEGFPLPLAENPDVPLLTTALSAAVAAGLYLLAAPGNYAPDP